MANDFQRVSADQVQQLRQQGAVLVDIRDAHSFASAHIPGARHLDNHSLADFIAQADFDQPLIVTCYHGMSSQGAAAYLAQQGFSAVYSLNGGFELWRTVFPQDIASGAE
jgi:thiosulfate sulfurtransferase